MGASTGPSQPFSSWLKDGPPPAVPLDNTGQKIDRSRLVGIPIPHTWAAGSCDCPQQDGALADDLACHLGPNGDESTLRVSCRSGEPKRHARSSPEIRTSHHLFGIAVDTCRLVRPISAEPTGASQNRRAATDCRTSSWQRTESSGGGRTNHHGQIWAIAWRNRRGVSRIKTSYHRGQSPAASIRAEDGCATDCSRLKGGSIVQRG